MHLLKLIIAYTSQRQLMEWLSTSPDDNLIENLRSFINKNVFENEKKKYSIKSVCEAIKTIERIVKIETVEKLESMIKKVLNVT